MFPTAFDLFGSIRVVVNRHLCDRRFAGWRRTNRNNRIAKKWRKKYGPIIGPCRQEKSYTMGGSLFFCPCVERKLREAVRSDTPRLKPGACSAMGRPR